MIVVAIIGLLAAIAIPSFVRARETSLNTRFAADLNVATGAFIEYAQEKGNYPPDVLPGIVPAGMDDFLLRMHWTESTSLGGEWDWDYKQFGCTAGVSVHGPTAGVAELKRLDKLIDDGDLSTGNFRQRSAGYIFIIE